MMAGGWEEVAKCLFFGYIMSQDAIVCLFNILDSQCRIFSPLV